MKYKRQDAKVGKMRHERKSELFSWRIFPTLASWRSLQIVPFLAMLLLSGCNSHLMSRGVNMSAWQGNVEQYVKVQGKGDPSVLRDVTLPDGRKGYGMLGGPLVEQNADAFGVLLGFESVRGSPSFVYLVGLRDEGKLTDIRLAAVNFAGKKVNWWVGRSNPAALKTYLNFVRSKSASKSGVQNFPAHGDVFKLNVDADRLTASHGPSGATWTVSTGRSK